VSTGTRNSIAGEQNPCTTRFSVLPNIETAEVPKSHCRR
jgi:hypothetical protein